MFTRHWKIDPSRQCNPNIQSITSSKWLRSGTCGRSFALFRSLIPLHPSPYITVCLSVCVCVCVGRCDLTHFCWSVSPTHTHTHTHTHALQHLRYKTVVPCVTGQLFLRRTLYMSDCCLVLISNFLTSLIGATCGRTCTHTHAHTPCCTWLHNTDTYTVEHLLLCFQSCVILNTKIQTTIETLSLWVVNKHLHVRLIIVLYRFLIIISFGSCWHIQTVQTFFSRVGISWERRPDY